MRNCFKQGAIVCLMAVVGVVQAATATLSAGSPQTVLLTDPQTGSQVNLSLPFGGYSHLEFSNGTGVLAGVPTTTLGGVLRFILNKDVEVSSVGEGTVTPLYTPVGTRVKSMVRSSLYWDQGIGALTVDQASATIQSMAFNGGLHVYAMCTTGLIDGGDIVIKNLKFDFARKVVVGDLETSSEATSCAPAKPVRSIKNLDIWSFTMGSGSLTYPVAALAAKDPTRLQAAGFQVALKTRVPTGYAYDFSNRLVISSLKLTPQATAEFARGFGMAVGSVMYNSLMAVNFEQSGWGQVLIVNRFSATVP
jgi:hypothetical protein